ncbi:transmembrane protein 69 isoform X1 [Anguilla rostrata]|uniref:transmembrane protein 69 isoform X1 n=1 Tax=Anguilla rostrata TaxID=7938 RepID=UPI0030CF597A
MFRAVMKRQILNTFTGQSWQSVQQMSRMSSCRAQLGCLTSVSNSVPIGCSRLLRGMPSSCSWLLSGRPSADRVARLQPLHLSPASPHQRQRRQAEEPPPRELDLLRYDMRDLWKGPKPALYLGFSGLLPFVAPPLAMAVTELYFPDLAYAQVAYGASILSFLGGARWGFALPDGSPAKPDWLNLANSVVPSLMAWVALLFRDSITEAAVMVLMGLGVSLHYDLALLPTYPSWFKALRAILTLVATFSLVSTLILKGVYPEKKLSFGD